ncbi:MAG: hypothetical protein R2854_19565 [Caldilineaceae bacterium]
MDVATPPAAPWRWMDPRTAGSTSRTVSSSPPRRRDLWYVNETAPSLVRPVDGDFAIEYLLRTR